MKQCYSLFFPFKLPSIHEALFKQIEVEIEADFIGELPIICQNCCRTSCLADRTKIFDGTNLVIYSTIYCAETGILNLVVSPMSLRHILLDTIIRIACPGKGKDTTFRVLEHTM